MNLSLIVSIPGNRWRVVSRASAVSLSAPAKHPLFNWTRRRAPRGERKPAHRHTAEDRSDLQIEALVEACSLALASSREPGDVSISISHHLPTGRELSFYSPAISPLPLDQGAAAPEVRRADSRGGKVTAGAVRETAIVRATKLMLATRASRSLMPITSGTSDFSRESGTFNKFQG